MKTTRDFNPAVDRYFFDFAVCTTARGWAQIDTGQDFQFFGTWANPSRRKILTFSEGDLTIQTADTDAEFCAELRKIRDWHEASGKRFFGIDPGFSAELAGEFRRLGLDGLIG